MTQPSFKACPFCGKRMAYYLNMCDDCVRTRFTATPQPTPQTPMHPKLHPAILVACILLSVACVWYIGGSLWAQWQAHQIIASLENAKQEELAQSQRQLEIEAEHNRQIDSRAFQRERNENAEGLQTSRYGTEPVMPTFPTVPTPKPFAGGLGGAPAQNLPPPGGNMR